MAMQTVRFHDHPVEVRENGEIVTKMVPYIETKSTADTHTVGDRPATDADKAFWPDQWAAFVESKKSAEETIGPRLAAKEAELVKLRAENKKFKAKDAKARKAKAKAKAKAAAKKG